MDIYSMSHQHLISDEFKEKLKEVNSNFIENYGTYLPKDDYAKGTNINKYLFRGKRKDNGKWIEGGYCYCNNKSYIVIATQYIPDTRDWDTADYYEKNPVYQPTFIEVYTKTVGQYTGLTDKNYNKIFEGDIVKFGISQRIMYVHWNGETLTWELTDIGVPACEVNHLSNTFDLGEIQVESAYGEMFSEVVGNIYDNTELLNN